MMRANRQAFLEYERKMAILDGRLHLSGAVIGEVRLAVPFPLPK